MCACTWSAAKRSPRASTATSRIIATPRAWAAKRGSSAVELPDATAERCVALAAGLGLEFVGIDLKITPDGDAYCFEVNPCPAFSYYEANTGQPIARAVARRLAS